MRARLTTLVAAGLMLPGLAAMQPSQARQQSGLLGVWACQTPEGPAQLVFRSGNQLEYNGQATSYQLARNVIRVQSEYGPVDYRFQLSGSRLVIARPDGSRMQCQRQAGGQARGQPAGPSAGAQQAGGMEYLLQGMLCSYSSSPDGGYSSSTRVSFDGRGGFSVNSESSWSVEPGSGYADNPGDQGRYRVGGASVGSRVYLQFSDGSSGVAQVENVSQGRIDQLTYEGTLFASSLC